MPTTRIGKRAWKSSEMWWSASSILGLRSFAFNVLPGVLSQSIPLFLYGLSRARSSVISASVLGVMLFLAWRPAEFLFWGELGHARNKV